MIWQTSHLLLVSSPSGRLVGFVFFSTICSYNFHWYLTPGSVSLSRRVGWNQHHKILHFILFLVGGIRATIYFFSLLPYLLALCFRAFVTFLDFSSHIPHPFFR